MYPYKYQFQYLIISVGPSCGFSVGGNLVAPLEMCVSSVRRGRATLACIVQTLTDDLDADKWGQH